MRNISTTVITEKVSDLVKVTALYLRPDIMDFFKNAIIKEKDENAKKNLLKLIENAVTAQDKKVPYCQDTGFEIIFCEIGQEVHITDGSLDAAIQEGIKKGSKDGFLRQSIVEDPIIRKNTATNTPGIINYSIVEGDKIKFSCIAKGFGCENKGQVSMLNPTASINDIKDFVLKVIKEAGPNACPPFFIGIGLGGTMDKACELAKKALLEPVGKHNKKKHLATLEKEILTEANNLNTGPLGLGGNLSCIDIKIKEYACHIAGLPVAVNIGCHAVRTKTIVI
ncbi:MAG: fumarate hydratase [bacterium]|nr:fumarate hydratase [bacterium]